MGLMTIGTTTVDRQASEAAEIAAQAAHVAEADYWCRHVTAMQVARDLAELHGIRPETAWSALLRVPANLGSMFDSPEGWTALNEGVSGALGLPCRRFMPVVH